LSGPCWSSGFSLGNLTVVVDVGKTYTIAIGLLTHCERRLKPELQRTARGASLLLWATRASDAFVTMFAAVVPQCTVDVTQRSLIGSHSCAVCLSPEPTQASGRRTWPVGSLPRCEPEVYVSARTNRRSPGARRDPADPCGWTCSGCARPWGV